MNPEYLPLVAEIGIAIVGFGGLAGLIGRGSSSESPQIDAGRLRGMLERALTIVALALLPMALGQFPISDAAVWWSSAAILFVGAPYLSWSQRLRLRRLPNYTPGKLWLASAQINLIVQLGLLSAGFAGYVPLAPAYGFALLIELAVAGGQFLRVVASITSVRPGGKNRSEENFE